MKQLCLLFLLILNGPQVMAAEGGSFYPEGVTPPRNEDVIGFYKSFFDCYYEEASYEKLNFANSLVKGAFVMAQILDMDQICPLDREYLESLSKRIKKEKPLKGLNFIEKGLRIGITSFYDVLLTRSRMAFVKAQGVDFAKNRICYDNINLVHNISNAMILNFIGKDAKAGTPHYNWMCYMRMMYVEAGELLDALEKEKDNCVSLLTHKRYINLLNFSKKIMLETQLISIHEKLASFQAAAEKHLMEIVAKEYEKTKKNYDVVEAPKEIEEVQAEKMSQLDQVPSSPLKEEEAPAEVETEIARGDWVTPQDYAWKILEPEILNRTKIRLQATRQKKGGKVETLDLTLRVPRKDLRVPENKRKLHLTPCVRTYAGEEAYKASDVRHQFPRIMDAWILEYGALQVRETRFSIKHQCDIVQLYSVLELDVEQMEWLIESPEGREFEFSIGSVVSGSRDKIEVIFPGDLTKAAEDQPIENVFHRFIRPSTMQQP